MKIYNFLLLLSWFVVSCTDQNLPKYNKLDQLRILALISQPPEANPGDIVTIIPLLSDINETSALSYSAYSCLDLGISFGAEPTCQNNPSSITLSSGNITTLNISKAFTGAGDSINLTIPDQSTMLNLRSTQQQYNGVAYIFEYIIRNSRGDEVKSIKRIAVSSSTKTSKNNNPTMSDILFNGSTAGTSLPLSTTIYTNISFTSPPTETYSKMSNDGQLTNEIEEVVTTWFVTDGKMKYQRTIGLDTNEYETPSQIPNTRPAYMIGVSRDGRGGTGYLIKCFGICI